MKILRKHKNYKKKLQSTNYLNFLLYKNLKIIFQNYKGLIEMKNHRNSIRMKAIATFIRIHIVREKG